MKITRIESVLMSVPLAEDSAARWSGGEMTVASVSMLQVHTDSGLIGLGDTYGGGWFYPEAAGGLVEHFNGVLVGENPLDVARLLEKMRNSCKYWGRVGASINAISAIENALWDIAGQEAGLPVWKLIGGLAHERMPFYASAGQEKPADAMEREMSGYVRDGVPAVKIRTSTNFDQAVAKVARCRELLGPNIKLMVDAVMGSHPSPWDSKQAVKFAHAIAPYDITWLEEPCAADDYEGLAEVRRLSPVPISGGETMFGLIEFGHLLRNRSVDIVQPDACTSGGILECIRIAGAAALFGTKVAPHAWGSGVTVMANLHWAFTQPNVFIQEVPTWGFPLRDALLVEPLRIENGHLLPPTAPGLGVRLTDELRAAYPWQGGYGAKMRAA
ncbi:mandelate racemase/muconate lactonizing enzyme family protein [Devosia naphthalenivorans]|uniref:mandelate racemase/muconate lactonizing enzyme family protein n=1 Tax=Devosia naphthalenivorans TaxID=2082392 RepID=UPI000D37DEE7|nr:mandelate racemase/muconate lactonizing enzyme family protein [Devosia naphthalenivorans]